MSFSLSELQKLSIFQDLPQNLLSWLIEHGTSLELSDNAYMFNKNQPADHLFIIVSGTIERYEEIAGQLVIADLLRSGQVTGMLPFSRMKFYPGPAVVKEAAKVLRINKKHFHEMLMISEELGQRLIAEMTNRARGGVRIEQHLEKMASLGKLAAGLAHEVNNPASAIQRTAALTKEMLKRQRTHFISLHKFELSTENYWQIEDFIQLIDEKNPEILSPVAGLELEEKICEYFNGKFSEDFSEYCRILVRSGVTLEEVKKFSERFSSDVLMEVLSVLAVNIEINFMLTDVFNSANTISELVSSVKTYSHMDRSREFNPVNIAAGMDHTLRILDYKIKQKNINIFREYDEHLPEVNGNTGQLNQVWTHLLDNAVDALNEKGKIIIVIKKGGPGVHVKIIDNGSGIAEEIIDKIFDPFFTTKDIGEGTGLGLEISQRIITAHGGYIKAKSENGQTEILVVLPV